VGLDSVSFDSSKIYISSLNVNRNRYLLTVNKQLTKMLKNVKIDIDNIEMNL
jgi:hypothetical protein